MILGDEWIMGQLEADSTTACAITRFDAVLWEWADGLTLLASCGSAAGLAAGLGTGLDDDGGLTTVWTLIAKVATSSTSRRMKALIT